MDIIYDEDEDYSLYKWVAFLNIRNLRLKSVRMAMNVIMPRQGQSVESCIIGDVYKKKGDQVKEGEIILTFETDKAQFDLESPASGIILEMFCNTGDEIAVLSNIAVIGQPGESTDEVIAKETSLTTVDVSSTPEPAQLNDSKKSENQITATNGAEKIRISPRARNLAARLNIDVSQVKGSGPMGRILEKDVESASSALHTSGISPDPTIEKLPDTNEFVIRKISNVRRIIAENMHASLKNSAQLTHHISANASKILAYRKKLSPGFTDLSMLAGSMYLIFDCFFDFCANKFVGE